MDEVSELLSDSTKMERKKGRHDRDQSVKSNFFLAGKVNNNATYATTPLPPLWGVWQLRRLKACGSIDHIDWTMRLVLENIKMIQF